MQKKTITICAFKRPNYFEQLLRSLIKNNLQGWEILIQIEPSEVSSAFSDLAKKLLPSQSFSIHINEKILGVRKNPYSLLQQVFSAGSTLNIHLEEDLIVSPDLTQLAEWYAKQDHTNILCMNLITGGCDSAGFISHTDLPLSLVKTKCFNSLGFVLTPAQWTQYFKPNWLKDHAYFLNTSGLHSRGWDLSIYHCVLFTEPLKTLQPISARANHIGEHGGANCTESFHNQAFAHLRINTTCPDSSNYLIHNNPCEELPFIVHSHLNLWSEMGKSLIILKKVARLSLFPYINKPYATYLPRFLAYLKKKLLFKK